MEMDSIDEDLHTCPICLTVPENEVYQCINGHILCDKCMKKVKKHCPQCRVSIRGKKIRNRYMEMVIEKGRILDCPNAKMGCKEKILIKDLPSHKAVCKFGIQLCKSLGLPCQYKINMEKKDEVISHFESEHRCKVSKNGVFDLSECNKWGVKSAVFIKLMQLESSTETFLIVCKFVDEYATWISVNLSLSKGISDVYLSLSTTLLSKTDWHVLSVPIQDVESILKDPPYKVSKQYLKYLHHLNPALESWQQTLVSKCPLKFCQLLGLTSCEFQLNEFNLLKAASHLRDSHGFQYSKGEVRLLNFDKIACQVGNTVVGHLLQLDNSSSALLLVCRKEEDFLTWTCVEMNASSTVSNVRVEFTPVTLPNVKGQLLPIPLLNASEFLDNPPFKMSLSYLKQQGHKEEGNAKKMYWIYVKISRNDVDGAPKILLAPTDTGSDCFNHSKKPRLCSSNSI